MEDPDSFDVWKIWKPFREHELKINPSGSSHLCVIYASSMRHLVIIRGFMCASVISSLLFKGRIKRAKEQTSAGKCSRVLLVFNFELFLHASSKFFQMLVSRIFALPSILRFHFISSRFIFFHSFS